MTDTRPGPRLSRRMLFAGLGGGLASLPLLWWLDVPRRVRAALSPTPKAPPCCAYVDRDGWMLTPEDAAALAARQPAP